MSVGPLAVEIACVCCLAAFLLHRYGNWRKQHVLVTLATFISWYFSFMIIFVLPLDVSSTCYRQCLKDRMVPIPPPQPSPQGDNQSSIAPPLSSLLDSSANSSTTAQSGNGSSPAPSSSMTPFFPPAGHQGVCEIPWSHVPSYILPTLWHVVYWTSQILTWLILPMMQSYASAGDFTVVGKMKSSLIENAIYYGSYLLIFGVLLIYVAVRPDININGAGLKVMAITASNTWGLFLLVLLLGYGLVEVPRSCWHNSKRGYMLSQTHFKIAKLSLEKTEAEEALEDVLEDIRKAAESVRYTSPLRKHVDTILLKCPENMQHSVRRNTDATEDFNGPNDNPSEKGLIRLHKKVITATQRARRTQVQWNTLMEKSFDLEDVVVNEKSPDRRFKRVSGKYDGIFKKIHSPTLEWYWRCLIQPWGFRILAVLLCVFSFMVVWSECLFFIKTPVLSLFAVFVNLAKRNYEFFYIELASCITIAYLCVCAYYTVFKIRILNYYYLSPNHQTDENSLLFSGTLLCRLTPPLCLNFLGLIHLDTHITKQKHLEETSYTKIMGHMDVISFIANGFNIYFPIAIVVLCIATYFNLGSRFLHLLGFEQFVGEDEMTQDLTDEGRELVKRERRHRERQEDGEARRRNWAERFGRDNGADIGSRQYRERDMEPEIGKPRGRGTALSPASSEDNDRTELLKQSEPVDYTGESTDMMFEDMTRDLSISGAGRYQAQPLSRPTSFTGSQSTRKPPRGIFDDI